MNKITCHSLFLYYLLFSINANALGISPSAVTNMPFKTSASLLKPQITGFSTSGCVKPGAAITVLGNYLGRETSIALGINNTHITIKPSVWLSNKIIAYLPNDSQIKPGARYFVAIRNLSANVWVSNTDKTIIICKPAAPRKITLPEYTKLAPKTPPMTTATDPTPPDLQPNDATEENSDSSTEPALPGDAGSLMGRKTPPPPTAMAESATKDASGNVIAEPNELIVISKNMNAAQQLAKQLSSYGLTAKKRKLLKHLSLVITTYRVPADVDLQQTTIKIRQTYPNMWTDVNHRYTLQGNNNDTRSAKAMIHWTNNISQCGKGLRIGMIDTEINTMHPALKTQNIISHTVLTHGIKKANKDHGTAIATILVGSNNAKTFSGMLPSAGLYSVSVFRQRDENHVDTTAEWIISAIDWLLSQNVQVINISIGGPYNALVEIAIQRTIKSGVAVIAAAGNNGANAPAVYPAAQAGVIAVTAVDSEMVVFSKANQGQYIDFAAPGVEIWAGNENGEGKFVSGTSFSAPFVTASIANIIGKHGIKQAYSNLQKNAKDLGKKGKDKQFGWGLVQASGICQ